jgi:hypothetical protein
MMRAYGVDAGVLLVAAWMMTQLSPETLLFGSGNLRQMLDLPPVQPFLAQRFVNLETVIAAAGLLAAGLITTMLLRRHARLLTGGLLLVAVLVKVLAHALLMGPAAALAWLTPGKQSGPGHRTGRLVECVLPGLSPATRCGRAGPAVRHGDGQCGAGQSLPEQYPANLESWPVPEFQRAYATDLFAVALPRPALADDLPSREEQCLRLLTSAPCAMPCAPSAPSATGIVSTRRRTWSWRSASRAAELVEHFQWSTPEESLNLAARKTRQGRRRNRRRADLPDRTGRRARHRPDRSGTRQDRQERGQIPATPIIEFCRKLPHEPFQAPCVLLYQPARRGRSLLQQPWRGRHARLCQGPRQGARRHRAGQGPHQLRRLPRPAASRGRCW